MVPQLEDYQQQFEGIKEDAEKLISGLNSYGFHWHPSPRTWSIAENLDHLVVLGTLLFLLITGNRLPVRLSSKADFSDYVDDRGV